MYGGDFYEMNFYIVDVALNVRFGTEFIRNLEF